MTHQISKEQFLSLLPQDESGLTNSFVGKFFSLAAYHEKKYNSNLLFAIIEYLRDSDLLSFDLYSNEEVKFLNELILDLVSFKLSGSITSPKGDIDLIHFAEQKIMNLAESNSSNKFEEIREVCDLIILIKEIYAENTNNPTD